MARTKPRIGWPLPPIVAALACLLGGVTLVEGQVSPVGPDFQVNAYTTGNQFLPGAAALGADAFVVVWQSDGSLGSDSSGYSVQAQIYDSRGTPVGGEFQVNLETIHDQGHPSVAADFQGNFVVAWENGGWESGWGWNIRARRFDASGFALGGEFQVNFEGRGWHRSPDVASDALGNFVVVWEDYDVATSSFGVRGRLFSADGVPRGGELSISSNPTAAEITYPDVASNAFGDLVSVWAGYDPQGLEPGLNIRARRIDHFGNLLGPEFQANTYTTGNQQLPSVAMDARGGFVVAWTSSGSSGTDSSYWSVLGQRYDDTGAPAGDEFQINTYTTGQQEDPVVAMARRGDFVIEWTSSHSSGTDHSSESVQAQFYRADGTPLEDQFQVNTFTTGRQRSGAVAVDRLGTALFAWVSDGSSGSDHYFYSVQGRLYDGLFRDGLETGNTSRWSATAP